MNWREKLQPGSFRGAPFLIDGANSDFGRRVQVHEYPLRDLPYAEDLGRKAKTFRIDCLVLGPQYMAARDALIEACDAKGPGTLVHPYYGRRRVVVTSSSVRESTNEGGVARFSIQFAEAGDKIEPTAAADTAALVQSQTDAAAPILANSFAQRYSTEGLPQWVADAAEADGSLFLDTVEGLRDSIPGIPDEVSAYNAQLKAVSDALASLIRDPYNLGASIVDLIFGLATIAQQPLDALGLYKHLFAFGTDAKPITTATPARMQQAANRSALHGIIQQTAVIAAAAATAKVPAATTTIGGIVTRGYDSTNTARDVRNTVTDALDDQALTADDATYTLLTDLRAAVVTDLDTRAAALPGLVDFTPAQTLPALVIAYRLYADANRAAEIVSRNNLIYPGFAPGGEALEVLSE